MKMILILLAGYPGTGKSYLAELIMRRIDGFAVCSPDVIKEEFWDMYGFDSLEEKENLITKSWEAYYLKIKEYFQQGISVISDYPFSEKQKDALSLCAKQFDVEILTIRLVGDLDVLFERQKGRDLNNTRHLGHIVKKYHKGMKIDHDNADNLLSEEEFKKRCMTRGYGEFSLGKTIEIDVSDFAKVNYENVFELIMMIKA